MPFQVKTLAPVHENIVFLFCTKITSTKYKISLEFCHNHNIKVTNNKHVPLFQFLFKKCFQVFCKVNVKFQFKLACKKHVILVYAPLNDRTHKQKTCRTFLLHKWHVLISTTYCNFISYSQLRTLVCIPNEKMNTNLQNVTGHKNTHTGIIKFTLVFKKVHKLYILWHMHTYTHKKGGNHIG